MSHPPEILFAVPRGDPLHRRLWTEAAEAAAEAGGLAMRFLDALPADAAGWAAALAGCDAVVTSWGTPCLDREVLARADRLRVVAHAAGSVADLVSDHLYGRGIQVISANGVMAGGVAEWCVGMAVLAYGGFHRCAAIDRARPLRWEGREACRSLVQARIGIWGFGAVARALVERLRPMAPRALRICPDYPCADGLRRLGLEQTDWDGLFADCDVVVLAAGLTAASEGAVGARELARLADGAVLINPGRARLVQEDALLALAAQDRVTVCLDVFHREPLSADDPLLALPGVIATPHAAGIGTMAAYVPDLLRRLGACFAGGPLEGAVGREEALRMTSHRRAAGHA